MKISAVIVTYNPNKKKLTSNLRKMMSQFRKIVIINNSIGSDLSLSYFPDVSIINLHQNYGIAYAQNVGIKVLIGESDEYIMFFDQDSFLTANQISKLKEDLLSLENFAIVAPIFGRLGNSIVSVPQTLSSGSIIPVKCFSTVGLMREDLFIDLVDYEWCWRARRAGYKIFIDTRVKLHHSLGEGKKLAIGIAEPFRLYYQFRNIIYLGTRKLMPLNYLLSSIIKLPIRFLTYLIIMDERKRRLRYMLLGIRDGIVGKMGKLKL